MSPWPQGTTGGGDDVLADGSNPPPDPPGRAAIRPDMPAPMSGHGRGHLAMRTSTQNDSFRGYGTRGATHWSTRLLADRLKAQLLGDRAGLAGLRDQALEGGVVPVLHRPRAGREGHRHLRAVPGATGERDRAVRGREVPDPGAGPHRADPADAGGPDRAPVPRLLPARHLDPVRRARHRHRPGHRRAEAAAPPPGVPGVPQADRADLPSRRRRRRRTGRAAPGDGQLRRPQAHQRPRLARERTRGSSSTSPRPTPRG